MKTINSINPVKFIAGIQYRCTEDPSKIVHACMKTAGGLVMQRVNAYADEDGVFLYEHPSVIWCAQHGNGFLPLRDLDPKVKDMLEMEHKELFKTAVATGKYQTEGNGEIFFLREVADANEDLDLDTVIAEAKEEAKADREKGAAGQSDMTSVSGLISEWVKFKDAAYSDGMTEHQEQESRRCFFAGMASASAYLFNIADDSDVDATAWRITAFQQALSEIPNRI